MSSTEDQDRAYAVLSGILGHIHGQLQFAESKNAALLAANFAVVVGIGAIFTISTAFPTAISMWLFVTCIGLSTGGLISLSSFLPIMGNARHQFAGGDGSGVGGDNLIFWGEIERFTPAGYLTAVLSDMSLVELRESRLLADTANQIVINAGIAGRKFRRFSLAAVFTSVAIVVPAALLAATWILSGFKFT